MKAMTEKPLSSFSNEWKPIPQQTRRDYHLQSWLLLLLLE